MFFVGLDRKQAPWRGCYTADELEVVELSTPHIQLPSQEYVAQMREKALHESICAAGLGHFLANPRVLAERGHFVVLDDGREQFVLDGKPMVEFGPLTIETVPEKIGQTAIRMFRSVKALV